MINSLNQIIAHFKSFADSHGQINDFSYGPVSEWGSSRSQQFPTLWVTHTQSGTINATERTVIPEFRFTFLFVDQINQQENPDGLQGLQSDNGQEIVSDQFQIATDFLIWAQNFKTLQKRIWTVESPTFDFIYNETKDKVYGVRLDFTLKVINFNCTIPT